MKKLLITLGIVASCGLIVAVIAQTDDSIPRGEEERVPTPPEGNLDADPAPRAKEAPAESPAELPVLFEDIRPVEGKASTEGRIDR